jgi:mono/diheme cytochrome c family protein
MAKTSIEEESYSTVIFWVTVALLLVTVWAIYDEVEVRRPWKAYQREFHSALATRIDSLTDEAEAALEAPEAREEREAIARELEIAKAVLRSPEVERTIARQRQAEDTLREVRQEYTFKKSEYDEAYYFYKLSQHEGGDPVPYKRKLDVLQSTLSRLEKEIEERSESLRAQRAAVSTYVDTVTALEERLETMSKMVETLRFQREELASRPVKIHQVVLDELGTVERCQTCHVAIDIRGFDGPQDRHPLRTHPELSVSLGNHPMEEFGCTVCHEGQGAQTKGVGHRPFAHGLNDPYWARAMLRAPFTESSCQKCHTQEWEVESAANLNLGRRLFDELGCFGCHPVDGYSGFRKVGPDLTRLSGKVNPGWLVRWIGDPMGLRTGTRMPSFWPEASDEDGHVREGSPQVAKRDDEVLAIAAYLWVNSSPDIAENPGEIAGDAVQGEHLFRSVGCVGCHRPDALGLPPLSERKVGRDFAPNLSHIGSKSNYDWLFSWIRNPKRHSPDTKMPSLRLAKQEVADIAVYLMTLKRPETFSEPSIFAAGEEQRLHELADKGKELIGNYECYGCHNINGFEELRPALELNGFGSKPPVRLAFGDAITDHKDQDWYSWTKLKLERPRAFQTERIPLRMPDFSLSEDEVLALMVFLKGLGDESTAPEYMRRLSEKERNLAAGERLVNHYNCRGCHRIGGFGGDISSVIPEAALNPPDLTLEGRKVQPAWLFDFLKRPVTLRPWLALRMPTFGLDSAEANDIISYLMALADEEELFVENPPEPPVQWSTAGAEMFEKLKCIQCHQLTTDESVTLSDLAPDLGLARSRLRPQWVADWLIDPQALQPETKMPTFFPLEDDDDPESITTPLPDVLDGDVHEQIRAIRDYLFYLGVNS